MATWELNRRLHNNAPRIENGKFPFLMVAMEMEVPNRPAFYSRIFELAHSWRLKGVRDETNGKGLVFLMDMYTYRLENG